MTRNRLYLLLCVALICAYCWVGWYILYQDTAPTSFTPCLFKNATGLPCPSCGTTRSVAEIAKGNFIKAATINPLGFIVAAFMAVAPFWIIFDVAANKSTLHTSYQSFETALKKCWLALLLVSLVVLNWIWNIYKEL